MRYMGLADDRLINDTLGTMGQKKAAGTETAYKKERK